MLITRLTERRWAGRRCDTGSYEQVYLAKQFSSSAWTLTNLGAEMRDAWKGRGRWSWGIYTDFVLFIISSSMGESMKVNVQVRFKSLVSFIIMASKGLLLGVVDETWLENQREVICISHNEEKGANGIVQKKRSDRTGTMNQENYLCNWIEGVVKCIFMLHTYTASSGWGGGGVREGGRRPWELRRYARHTWKR